MEQLSKNEKKAKFWNMVLLIFGAVSGVMGILELPSVFSNSTIDMSNPSLAKVTDPAILKTVEKSMAILNNPLYQGYTVVMLLVSLILVAAFFQNHQAFNRGKPLNRWPYYLHVIKLMLAIVTSFLTGAALISSSLALTTLLLNITWSVPALLVLYNLKVSTKLSSDVGA